jgi:hypothetical protein
MTFWIHDYQILFQKDKLQIWPTDDMTTDDKLNAISRFVILLSLLGFILTQTARFLWIGFVTLAIIVMYHQAEIKEGFTKPKEKHTVPTEKNPLMNVLLPEINGNPNRGKALAHSPKTEKKIMEKVKKGLDPRIYRGTNNELDLEYSMRQFYTNPSTTVPNNQEEFATFCYGDMISAKEGNEMALARQSPRVGSV